MVNKSKEIVLVDEPRPGQANYRPRIQKWPITGYPKKGCEASLYDPSRNRICLFEKYDSGPGDRDRSLVEVRFGFLNITMPLLLVGVIAAQLTFPPPLDADPRPSDADISRDGRHILIIMQAGGLVYERALGQSVADALKTKPVFLPPKRQGLGEAGCFRYKAGLLYSVLTVGEKTHCVMQERKVKP